MKGKKKKMDFDKETEKQRIMSDLQEKPIAFYCDECKVEIYEGNEAYSFINGTICEDCIDKELEQIKKNARFITGEN